MGKGGAGSDGNNQTAGAKVDQKVGVRWMTPGVPKSTASEPLLVERRETKKTFVWGFGGGGDGSAEGRN